MTTLVWNVASSWCASKVLMVCGQGTCTTWCMVHVAFCFLLSSMRQGCLDTKPWFPPCQLVNLGQVNYG